MATLQHAQRLREESAAAHPQSHPHPHPYPHRSRPQPQAQPQTQQTHHPRCQSHPHPHPHHPQVLPPPPPDAIALHTLNSQRQAAGVSSNPQLHPHMHQHPAYPPPPSTTSTVTLVSHKPSIAMGSEADRIAGAHPLRQLVICAFVFGLPLHVCYVVFVHWPMSICAIVFYCCSVAFNALIVLISRTAKPGQPVHPGLRFFCFIGDLAWALSTIITFILMWALDMYMYADWRWRSDMDKGQSALQSYSSMFLLLNFFVSAYLALAALYHSSRIRSIFGQFSGQGHATCCPNCNEPIAYRRTRRVDGSPHSGHYQEAPATDDVDSEMYADDGEETNLLQPDLAEASKFRVDVGH